MTQAQVAAVVGPSVGLVAVLLLHFLTPTAVGEVILVAGFVGQTAAALANALAVTAPKDNAVLKAAAAEGITKDTIEPVTVVK